MVTYWFYKYEMTPEDESYLYFIVNVDVVTSPLVTENGASRLAD